jgi:hypothetical protein
MISNNINALREYSNDYGVHPSEIADIDSMFDDDVLANLNTESEVSIDSCIKVFIGKEDLTNQEKILLGNIKIFLLRIASEYRMQMKRLLENYRFKNPNLTVEIINKIIEKGYDLPRFSIYSASEGDDFIYKNKIQDNSNEPWQFSKGSFLVNFNLPRPLARFWYRSKNKRPVPKGYIEWGEFYERSVPVIWDEIDKMRDEGHLNFHRINPDGQHIANLYYYLWDVTAK